MGAETFTSWQPHEALPRRVEVASIRDEEEGLCVVLCAEETREAVVKLIFQDFVGYRNINESFRSRTWQSQDMGALPSLVTVHGSLWLKWLCEESSDILDEATLTHYAIYTSDDCIDVAARRAPLVIALVRGS
jgi:hypothetical protein